MAIAPRLELKQGQTLVMTPQLQQAIKLLQLSNLELADYVEAELEKNPLLERDDQQGEPEHAREDAPAAADAPDSAALDKTLGKEDIGTATDLDAGRDDLNTDETRAEKQASSSSDASLSDWSRLGSGGSDGDDDFEGRLAAEVTLKNHLESQLAIAALLPHQRFIAEVLIEAVDETGYLRADLNEIAERLGTSHEDCETTLLVLHGFDPAGVFARDLVECLALQLKERDRLDPAMKAMLTRLDLVAKRDIAALSALCSLDASDIGDMIAEIRALNPKPGLAFGS